MRVYRVAFIFIVLAMVSAIPKFSNFKNKKGVSVLRLRESFRMLWNIRKKMDQGTPVPKRELMLKTYKRVKKKKGLVSEKDRKAIATVYDEMYRKDLKKLMQVMHKFPIPTQESLLTIMGKIWDRNYAPLEGEDVVDEALAQLKSHPEWITIETSGNNPENRNKNRSDESENALDEKDENASDDDNDNGFDDDVYERHFDDNNEKECAICLEPLEENNVKSTLPGCGHEFHLVCILKWYYQNKVCPVCRHPVVMDANAEPPVSSDERNDSYKKTHNIGWLKNEILHEFHYIFQNMYHESQ